MKNSNYYTPSQEAINKAGLQNILILSIDKLTGAMVTVNGQLDTLKSDYKLYNGRTFGLNSDAWVNMSANDFNKAKGYRKSPQCFISFNQTILSYNQSTDILNYSKD